MRDRISPVGVVKEAFSLIKADKKCYLKLGVSFVVLDFFFTWSQVDASEEMAAVRGSVLLLAMIIGYPILFLKTLQRAMGQLRGGLPEAVPPFKSRFFKFLLGLFALGVISKIMSNLISAPLSILFVIGTDSSQIAGINTDALHPLLPVFSMLLAYVLTVRFGFILPPIAMDDLYNYASAWKLGKRHTFRIFLTILPYLLFSMALGVSMALIGTDIAHLFSPVNIVFAACSGFVTVVAIVAYAVWYEKLNAAQNVLTEEPAEAEEVVQNG